MNLRIGPGNVVSRLTNDRYEQGISKLVVPYREFHHSENRAHNSFHKTRSAATCDTFTMYLQYFKKQAPNEESVAIEPVQTLGPKQQQTGKPPHKTTLHAKSGTELRTTGDDNRRTNLRTLQTLLDEQSNSQKKQEETAIQKEKTSKTTEFRLEIGKVLVKFWGPMQMMRRVMRVA